LPPAGPLLLQPAETKWSVGFAKAQPNAGFCWVAAPKEAHNTMITVTLLSGRALMSSEKQPLHLVAPARIAFSEGMAKGLMREAVGCDHHVPAVRYLDQRLE
jgi:hypothetical protein